MGLLVKFCELSSQAMKIFKHENIDKIKAMQCYHKKYTFGSSLPTKGVYILQNTMVMVGGGVNGCWGKKFKLRVWGEK